MDDGLVDRLRLVNPYSGSQVLAVCREAADEIERLRTAGDKLATRLRWWTACDTDEAYSDHETLRTWEQITCG